MNSPFILTDNWIKVTNFIYTGYIYVDSFLQGTLLQHNNNIYNLIILY